MFWGTQLKSQRKKSLEQVLKCSGSSSANLMLWELHLICKVLPRSSPPSQISWVILTFPGHLLPWISSLCSETHLTVEVCVHPVLSALALRVKLSAKTSQLCSVCAVSLEDRFPNACGWSITMLC